MAEGNGNPLPPSLPTILVGWDKETQGVQVGFKTDEFKSFDLLIAVLQMAISELEFKRNLVRAQQLQQQAAAAAQTQLLMNKIRR